MLYFWTKVLHITAMTVWFTGLFFLPRLFVAKARGGEHADVSHLNAMGKTLYFGIMTPAALLTIGFGLGLIAFGFEGVWLPLKLVLVSVLVMMHLYYGQLLLDLTHDRARHRAPFYLVIHWVPLALMLAIAALTAAKPRTLPPLG
jgi:protoporphyrinogen IX oxidase